MMTSFQQYTLDVYLKEETTFGNYCIGPNDALYHHLLMCKPNQDFNPVLLWGRNSVGKTHLLQALCHHIHPQGWPVVYLPLAEHARFTPDILQGIEAMGAVCWDDIDQVIGLPEWEQALFHAYNRIQAKQGVLCISSSQPLKPLHFKLPDLLSRLLSCLTFEIKPLSDMQKLSVLQNRAQLRGLVLSERVVHYLLHHYSRDMRILIQALDTLDQASLAQGRCLLSVPFVKKIL